MQHTKQTERALIAATEFTALVAAGDHTRADQVERTIDELVGRWRRDGQTFVRVWPGAVAKAAGVPVVRLRRNRRQS